MLNCEEVSVSNYRNLTPKSIGDTVSILQEYSDITSLKTAAFPESRNVAFFFRGMVYTLIASFGWHNGCISIAIQSTERLRRWPADSYVYTHRQ